MKKILLFIMLLIATTTFAQTIEVSMQEPIEGKTRNGERIVYNPETGILTATTNSDTMEIIVHRVQLLYERKKLSYEFYGMQNGNAYLVATISPLTGLFPKFSVIKNDWLWKIWG